MSKKEKAQGLIISWATADGIVVDSLKNQRDYLKSELKKWKKNPKSDANPTGYWLHPEDVSTNEIMIHHMDAIIGYYGG